MAVSVIVNKTNPQNKWREDNFNVDLKEDWVGSYRAKLKLSTRRGRSIDMFMDEVDRVALIKSLLRSGEWVMGLPGGKNE